MTRDSEHRTLNSSSNGSTVRLKKPHACGGNEFTVVRESVVVILKCNKCGSIVRVPRGKYEKAVIREP